MKQDTKRLCNCCGQELTRCGNRYEDYVHIGKQWGYLSGQDGYTEEMDICVACFARWTSTFAIAPEKYPTTELL